MLNNGWEAIEEWSMKEKRDEVETQEVRTLWLYTEDEADSLVLFPAAILREYISPFLKSDRAARRGAAAVIPPRVSWGGFLFSIKPFADTEEAQIFSSPSITVPLRSMSGCQLWLQVPSVCTAG